MGRLSTPSPPLLWEKFQKIPFFFGQRPLAQSTQAQSHNPNHCNSKTMRQFNIAPAPLKQQLPRNLSTFLSKVVNQQDKA